MGFPLLPLRSRSWLAALACAAATLLTGCGYNQFQALDEQTGAAWSEVLNQYQRRADLIPNIVATVKGEANFEQETLTRVIEARARATERLVERDEEAELIRRRRERAAVEVDVAGVGRDDVINTTATINQQHQKRSTLARARQRREFPR
jgi:hypothetical protein